MTTERLIPLLVPNIVTLKLKDRTIYHQRYVGDFHPSANNKPTHTFAYFGLDVPYYGFDNHNNTYRYKCVIDAIPNMIEMNSIIHPEDLYSWIEYQLSLKAKDCGVKDVSSEVTIQTQDFGEKNLCLESCETNKTILINKKDISVEIKRDAYILAQHMIDLGYNGWFCANNNEYIFSQNVVNQGLIFVDSKIVNQNVPEKETHGNYYI